MAMVTELQRADESSRAAAHTAEEESAASAARCAALQARLEIVQQQCDALHLNCQRQLAELAAGAEGSTITREQLAALQQAHEEVQRQRATDAPAAAHDALQMRGELGALRQHIDGLQAGAQQLAEGHAAELRRVDGDWEIKLVAERQATVLQWQEAAAAAAAAQQLVEQQWAVRLQEQAAADAAAANDKLAALAAQHQAKVWLHVHLT